MDQERREQIRKRAEKATPGPWHQLTPLQCVGMASAEEPEESRWETMTSTVGLMVGPLEPECFAIGTGFVVVSEDPEREDIGADALWGDTAFIAHARQDIPDLLDALAASEARADRLAVALEAMRAAFVKHRTTTHEVKPHHCVTCRESAAILSAEPDARGAAILEAADKMAAAIHWWMTCEESEVVWHTEKAQERALAAYRALRSAEPATGEAG